MHIASFITLTFGRQ